MESTYGGRSHPESDPFTALAEIASATLGRGGVLMIPAFAVGRSQAILYTIHRLTSEGRVPRAPVFLNSQMAIDVTDLYTKHTSFHRLSDEECQALRASATYVRSVTESKALNRSAGPMVIVAGAGMLSGGRILHHLKAFGGDPGNALVLVGYQAAGTRGAALLRGDDTLKIHGGHWPIRARVEKLDMYSAHGDDDDLVDWLSDVAGTASPRKVFLVHGEPSAAEAMRSSVETRLGIEADVADYLETVALD